MRFVSWECAILEECERGEDVAKAVIESPGGPATGRYPDGGSASIASSDVSQFQLLPRAGDMILSAKIHEPVPELVEAIMPTAMMLHEQLHHPARKLRPSALFAHSRELIEVGLVED